MTWPSVAWAESHSILETLQIISCQVTQTALPTDAVFLEEICPNIVNILPLDYQCNIEDQHSFFIFSARSCTPCATITFNTKMCCRELLCLSKSSLPTIQHIILEFLGSLQLPLTSGWSGGNYRDTVTEDWPCPGQSFKLIELGR